MHVEFPGLFDLQVNGFGGVDFNSPLTTPEEVHRAIEQLRWRGVTRFLPTLGTSSFERFARCAKTLIQTPHPAMVGLHMEGPYISPEDGARGAHPREYVVAASRDDFLRRQEAAAGRIKLVTLAEILPMASTQPPRYVGLQTAGRVTADWNAADCRLSNLKVFNA